MYRKLFESEDLAEIKQALAVLVERLDALGLIVSAAYVQQAIDAVQTDNRSDHVRVN